MRLAYEAVKACSVSYRVSSVINVVLAVSRDRLVSLVLGETWQLSKVG